MKNLKTKKIIIVAVTLFVFGFSLHTIAAAPAGNFWFQFFATTQTGSDNTGDGGTGNPADYNYYYVGQIVKFRADVNILPPSTSNGADLIVNFDKNILRGSLLNGLSAYDTYSYVSNGNHDLNIDNTNGKFNLTGTNFSGNYYNGQRQYAEIYFTMLKPTAYNYGTNSTALTINYTAASSTDTNIAYNGNDLMDSKEDFNMIVWADTKKPYVQNPSPANGATNVPVTSLYTFNIRDSKNGAGDDSGYGIGFVSPPNGRTVNINNGIATTSYTALTSHVCTGINLSVCNATTTPTSPLGISGDTRKWNYNTLYTVTLSGYQDQASNAQSQLGDANGPNAITTTTYTFRTESDTTAPTATTTLPIAGATNVSVSTQIIVDVTDIKATNVSGTGVNSSTCRINVSSPNTGTTIYTSTSSGVVVSSINYGYRFTITRGSSFPQNEIVTVNTSGCQDLVGNTMSTSISTFTTVDAAAPYIGSFSPSSSPSVATNTTVRFTILDSGTGVDLNNTILYINGNFYKVGGGAGSVSISTGIPVKISFSTSTNLSTFSTATSSGADNGYAIAINNLSLPQSQAIPVVIYSKDMNSNVMPTYVASFYTDGPSAVVDGSTYCGSGTTWNGSSCVTVPVIVDGSVYCGGNTMWNGSQCIDNSGTVDGSTYCGNNTTWNGSSCVGTSTQVLIDGSTYCGGNTSWNGTSCVAVSSVNSGGGVCLVPNVIPHLEVGNAFVTQINSNGVLVTWNSGDMATGEVRYGTSEKDLNTLVKEDTSTLNTYHSVVINNLEVGKLYYFQPISKKNSNSVSGAILKMSPLYTVKVAEGSQSPKQSVANSSYTTICKPVTIIKEINSDGSVSQNIIQANDSVKESDTVNASSTVVEKTKNIISKNLIYIVAGILSVLIITTLSVMFIRNRRNSDSVLININNLKNMFKSKYAISGIIVVAIIIAGSLLFFAYKDSSIFDKFFGRVDNTPKNISISGNVIDPFTLQGVGDVDLDTVMAGIKTAPDGSFDFNQINNHEGIKITHPLLQRALLLDLSQIKTDTRMNIYFDADMFNTLNTYLNNLYQKKWNKITDALTNSCKEKISADMISKENLSFREDFSSIQTLDISNLDSVSGWYSDACQNRFQRVAVVYVKVSDKYEKFILTKEGTTWKIVK